MREPAILLILTFASSFLEAPTAERKEATPFAPSCQAGGLRSHTFGFEAESVGIEIMKLEPNALRFRSVEQFEGPCAAHVAASVMGLVQLTDGSVLQRPSSPTSAYEPWDRGRGAFEDQYDNRSSDEKRLPRVRGASLLASELVNAKPAGGDFVGVWRLDGKWIVQAFSQRQDRGFTTPRPILSSRLPIRSVQYFPSPDAPSGGLYVLQEQPDGRTRELGFLWFHHKTYDENGD